MATTFGRQDNDIACYVSYYPHLQDPNAPEPQQVYGYAPEIEQFTLPTMVFIGDEEQYQRRRVIETSIEIMQEAGREAQLVIYPGVGRGFDFRPRNVRTFADDLAAKDAVQRAARFMRAQLARPLVIVAGDEALSGEALYNSDRAPDSVLYDLPQEVVPGVWSAIGATAPGTYANSGHNNNLSFVVTDEGVLVVNADDSGIVDLSDPILNLTFLFLGGVEIPAPGPLDCGPDPTDDGPGTDTDLGCEEFTCPCD